MTMTGCAARRVFAFTVALALLAACGNAGSGGDGDAAPQTSTGSTATTPGNDFTKNVPVDAPGVSADEIHVASITSKTNPVGGDYGRFDNGIEAYFDLVNSGGGIYGRRLQLTSRRDDLTGNNRPQAQALVSQDKVYAAFVGSVLFTGADVLAQAGIPTFGWNIGGEWAGPESFFPNVAPLCIEGCPLLPHVSPWLVRESKAHRVAVLGYSVPQSAGCVNGNLDNLEQFARDIDADVVFSDDSLPFGQTRFSAQVTKMKQNRVDFLISCMDFNGDYALAKEMKEQDLLDSVVFYHPNLNNPEFVKANAALLEGGIVLAGIAAAEHQPAPAGVQEYLDYVDEHGLKLSEATMQGWVAARQFVDALKAAGPDFTWKNLISSWNQQTWYTAGGWIVPIDWTRQHRNPADGVQFRSQFECANFVRVRAGKFVSIYDGGGEKPWVCFDGHQPDTWQEPVNLSFAGAPFDFADA
jgi:ABC-type branched-subunit amino acid transport system substrate-binding protein